ncbi:MAG: SpoIID/LytB domain-containing protein [Gammaproteobacteria bacterium]|nr:SpoIID/LytB domain-containing protein [Gammaproteobacteria bacterium]
MRSVSVVSALLLVVVMVSPAAAQEDTTSGPYRSVRIVPGDGTTLSWAGRHYAGSLEVTSASDGLVLLDHVGVDDYLLGIQEVPFSWPEAALRAQAVAARTYLAWTLARGRGGAGKTYGFDICASSACQVYGGLDQVASPSGKRWEAAVKSTSGDVLLYEGRPALAMYSSTTGGRTRNYEDVYEGRSPIPYLRAVPSPGEESAFAEWRYEVRGSVLEDVLEDAGLIKGLLSDVVVTETEDGDGPWMVEIRSREGTTRLTATEFRGVMNRWGPRAHPEAFPAFRPGGGRYPQTVLSPTFDVRKQWHFPDSFRSGYIDVYPVYEFEGHGWGHMVGMSQYGAKAMAEAGNDYGRILSHYYSGLIPESADDLLPETITVGLDWKEQTLRISADGPVSVIVDGQTIAVDAIGSWRFTYGGGVMLTPPEGFGLPPTVCNVPEMITGASGRSLLVSVTVTAPARVRLVVFRGAQVVTETPWKAREAGPVSLIWDGTVAGVTAPPGPYRLMIEARNSEGSATVFLTAVVAD